MINYKWHQKGTYDPVEYRAERIAKGLPVKGENLNKPIFEDNIFMTHTCWFWVGALRKDGYGSYGNPKVLAHRVAWERYVGPIPDGCQVLHSCDIPQCVNPSHLFLGDRIKNMRDAANKGRVGAMFRHFLTLRGRTQTLMDWSVELGVPYSTMWRRMKKGLRAEAIVLALFLAGCSPLRGYKFATHGPGDTSAGDLTHASEPGARVVVPKKPAKPPANGPYYISSFDKPHSDCVEIDHKLDTAIRTWACATK